MREDPVILLLLTPRLLRVLLRDLRLQPPLIPLHPVLPHIIRLPIRLRLIHPPLQQRDLQQPRHRALLQLQTSPTILRLLHTQLLHIPHPAGVPSTVADDPEAVAVDPAVPEEVVVEGVPAAEDNNIICNRPQQICN